MTLATLAFMNIGTQEMIFIFIIILLLFGGKKLPELARGLGKGIREFKDASDGIKREISDQINTFEKELDVTVEDTPAAKSKSATLAEEMNAQAAQPDLPKAAADANEAFAKADGEEQAEKPEEQKGFPAFTAPQNTYQHNPGEQPSSGDDHFSYGYNDHFASSESTPTSAEPQTTDKTTSVESDSPAKTV